jgi:hypothetical protein
MSLSCVKIQFQLLSNTEAKGIVFLNYACIPFSSSSFYVLGLSIAAPQSFWDGLTQERSAQSVNKMWIELVFVPESPLLIPLVAYELMSFQLSKMAAIRHIGFMLYDHSCLKMNSWSCLKLFTSIGA